MDKEGGYVTRSPLLDDSNYDIWKARMIAFLKSIDSRTWKAVLKGWEHPKVKDANGADTDELKPEEDWTDAEDSLALGNSKALNALFNGVDKNMFRLIKRCTVAKEAWEILKTTQEGTAKVKISRLQNLTRKFENLRMKEDESVHNFYMNVMDFANSFDDLGENLSDEKIVRKILRSLTKKFDMKVIAMEEAQDISTMKVDELIGSLQTYESSVNERLESKNKSIAFLSNTDDEDLEIDMESTDRAGNPRAAKGAVRVVAVIGIVEAIIVSTLFLCLGHVIGNAYSNDKEVIDYVKDMVPLLCVSLSADSIICALSGIARGGGFQTIGAYVNLGAYYLVGAPIAFLLGFSLKLNAKGLWMGTLTGSVLNVIILAVVTMLTDWQKEATKARERIAEKSIEAHDGSV
ncbi:hypothetical protein TSUD_323230 [Trifolium subterraneum]|uniref:DUF4219 domain-containing protein n=1 Tax=Trifolium subterraneum TaxID=3900 RepID=A0A2Z6N9X5_TRISU|nr:hypothetical protein TSUD_323230 [Trifolium subterraneum]